MNNATASLQSTVSFLLLTTLCSTISPSRMHTFSSELAQKKASAPSAAKHKKFAKCFIVLLTGECITEREQLGFSDSAVCRKCLIVAVVLLCLERVRTNMQGTISYNVYTCCCSKSTHTLNWKAGITLELEYSSIMRPTGSVWNWWRQCPTLHVPRGRGMASLHQTRPAAEKHITPPLLNSWTHS